MIETIIPAPAASCCTICGQNTTSSFAAGNYRLFTCARCDFAFLDPAVAASLSCEQIFDDAYFTGGGAGYTDYLAEARLLRARYTVRPFTRR